MAGAAGKKNRAKERRLMKGFNLAATGGTTAVGGGPPGRGSTGGAGTPGSIGKYPECIIPNKLVC